MKQFSLILILFSVVLFVSCGDDEETSDPVTPSESVVPSTFRVDIPPSISSESSGGKVSADPDSLFDMSFIYEAIPGFIEIGESAALTVEEIMVTIQKYNLSRAQAVSFVSDDDGRDKELIVRENVTASDEMYEYGMQIIDVDDQEVAMQVFWNTNPVKGFAIMNVFQIDRENDENLYSDTYYKIAYSEADTAADATMEVWIANFPIENADSFGVDNFRMFVSKSGDVVTVNGNSNHPNMAFENGTSGIVGRNYAFRARADEANDVGVIEVGLPPSDVNMPNAVYRDYNILEVVRAEYGSGIDSTLVFNYKAPGYFSEDGGFLGDGDYNADPNLFPASFVSLNGLRSFVPSEIRDLEISFEAF